MTEEASSRNSLRHKQPGHYNVQLQTTRRRSLRAGSLTSARGDSSASAGARDSSSETTRSAGGGCVRWGRRGRALGTTSERPVARRRARRRRALAAGDVWAARTPGGQVMLIPAVEAESRLDTISRACTGFRPALRALASMPRRGPRGGEAAAISVVCNSRGRPSARKSSALAHRARLGVRCTRLGRRIFQSTWCADGAASSKRRASMRRWCGRRRWHHLQGAQGCGRAATAVRRRGGERERKMSAPEEACRNWASAFGFRGAR